MDLIIVTGLSGAGKSQAVHCLEDIGYYCVDNMPPKLMKDFIKLANDRGNFSKVAFVTDVRGGQFFDELESSLSDLDSDGVNYKIMFLEASTPVIVRRYKESRRAHPLAPDGDIPSGIQKEREKLAHVKELASFVIDTSDFNTARLNTAIKTLLGAENKDSFSLTVMSFGFKNGMPQEADWVFDVRFLPNPFYVPSLKGLTGRNKKVKEYVLSGDEAGKFAGRITGLALDLIPSYIREGKYHLTIAIGCTGGRHRSVVMAEEIARRLSENGRHPVVMHRDS